MTIYVISSAGKSGGSSIATQVAEATQASYIYTGGLMREQAIKACYIKPEFQHLQQLPLDAADVTAFRRYCNGVNRDIDKQIDIITLMEMADAARGGYNLVVDAKLAGRLVNTSACWPLLIEIVKPSWGDLEALENYRQQIAAHVRAVWLTADVNVRAARSLAKQYPADQISSAMLEAEAQALTLRQQRDAADYLRIYGIDDYPVNGCQPGPGFGTVIDNSNHASIEETYACVIKALGIR
jgi:cytidylate kinase